MTAAGWQVLTLKWGRRITEIFEQPGAQELRRRLEEMPNEEYQRMVSVDASEIDGRVPGAPEAIEVTEQIWHVATTRAIYRSEGKRAELADSRRRRGVTLHARADGAAF